MQASEADLWKVSSLCSEKDLSSWSAWTRSKAPCFHFSLKTFSFHSNLRSCIIKDAHPEPPCFTSSSRFSVSRKPYGDMAKTIGTISGSQSSTHQLCDFFFFFWPCHMACGILVPQPGIAPVPPALEALSLNHWTTREVPTSFVILN